MQSFSKSFLHFTFLFFKKESESKKKNYPIPFQDIEVLLGLEVKLAGLLHL
jgi:hypothetical protein